MSIIKTGQIDINGIKYDTMHDGFQIEIQIVDHCNLKCGGCNHFSCIADPYCIPIEEFEDNLRVLSQFVPSLKRLMIVGGEPFLHPQIRDMMRMMRKYFPDPAFMIDILTNGIIVNSFDDDFFKECLSLGIKLLWTPYPEQEYDNLRRIYEWGHNPLDECPPIIYFSNEEYILKEDIERQGIDWKTAYPSNTSYTPVMPLYSRMFFAQPNFDPQGQGNIKWNYEHCPYYMIPTLIIRKSKIYLCPRAACNDILAEHFTEMAHVQINEGDYLECSKDLTIDNLQSFFEKGPRLICKYCRPEEHHFYWHKYSFGYQDFRAYNNLTAKDLFLDDYDKYDELVNGKFIFNYFLTQKALGDQTFWDLTDSVYGHKFVKPEINRINGLLDILIPFYKTSEVEIMRLIDSLKTQTIIDQCHLYIISDGASRETNELVYDLFKKHFVNLTFLNTQKNAGPGAARQLGIDNSFNPYIFQIDCDDKLISNNSLETMISLFQSDDTLDVVCGRVVSWDLLMDAPCPYDVDYTMKYPTDMHGYMYRRSFLKQCNIRYKPYFLHEDLDLYYQIIKANANIAICNQEIYLYLRSSPQSIGLRTNQTYKALYFLLAYMNVIKDYMNMVEKTGAITLEQQNGLISALNAIGALGGMQQNEIFESEQSFYELILIYYYGLKYLYERYAVQTSFINFDELFKVSNNLMGQTMLTKIKLNESFNFNDKVYVVKQDFIDLSLSYYKTILQTNMDYCFWLFE